MPRHTAYSNLSAPGSRARPNTSSPASKAALSCWRARQVTPWFVSGGAEATFVSGPANLGISKVARGSPKVGPSSPKVKRGTDKAERVAGKSRQGSANVTPGSWEVGHVSPEVRRGS